MPGASPRLGSASAKRQGGRPWVNRASLWPHACGIVMSGACGVRGPQMRWWIRLQGQRARLAARARTEESAGSRYLSPENHHHAGDPCLVHPQGSPAHTGRAWGLGGAQVKYSHAPR
jgi:hypothetical protein